MDDDAALHSIGLSRERRLPLDQTLSKKPKQPFVISKITWKLQNHAKKLMQTRSINLWSSKMEIMCIWEFHPWKAWRGLGERKFSTSLHWTVPHPREVWNCGLLAWPATILSWSSWHLRRVIIEEVFEGTCGRRVAHSDTTRGRFVAPRASGQGHGSEGSCHEA
jgi:hypothetical protein